MPAFANTVIEMGSNAVHRLVARKAAEQGGIISGDNPTRFDSTDPIRLWIIQVALCIIFTQALAWPLKRLRQPRVIAEIIAGVVLGPTAMGKIPHFSARIFPTQSLPFLNLTATVGLVLFLFLVGLEVDTRVIKRNARNSLIISSAGILLPFGLGAAGAVPIYNKFIDSEKASFGHFLLFTSVAISITAFPVLCRILTETKLLDTTVGVVVLASGVGNDVVGWVLLALTVALVNASTGLTALYILLAAVGGSLVILYPVRWGFVAMARRTGSLESGQPTPMMVMLTLLLVFSAAFFTDIIGIHPIFGGFLAGLIIPHEGGFAIALVEKLEDLVTILLLPIYFTLSGLKTDFTTLNTGIAWGYTFMLIAIAFFGKFLGCMGAAKFCGFNVRESGAIGALMSCKGLVELIVLNIGLQAGILDTRTFSMFVMMALILTMITTPLTLWIYPEDKRTLISTTVGDRPRPQKGVVNEATLAHGREEQLKTIFTVVLNKIEHLPSLMTLVQILQPPSAETPLSLVTSLESDKGTKDKKAATRVSNTGTPQVSIDALRLIELTDRTSAVMQSSEASDLLRRDALINVFRTFGHLNRIPVTSALSIVREESFPSSVAARARDIDSDLVIIPWSSRSSALEDVTTAAAPSSSAVNPFDALFGRGAGADKSTSAIYTQFIRRVFIESTSDIALFIDRGVSSLDASSGSGQHIFLPFFGGPDDRLALRLTVQLCMHPAVSATIIRVHKTEDNAITPTETKETEDPKTQATIASLAANLTVHSTSGAFPDTVYPAHTTQTRIASQAADDLAWEHFAQPPAIGTHTTATQSALSRITFSEESSPTPLHAITAITETQAKTAATNGKSLLVVVGRARRLAVAGHAAELRQLAGEHHLGSADLNKTVGPVATALIPTTSQAMLVVQEANYSSS